MEVYIIYAVGTSLLISFLLMPLLVKMLHRKNLLEHGGRRRVHRGYVPPMGGIIIYIAFILSMLVWLPRDLIEDNRFIVAAISLMFFAGIRDDLAPLKPFHKLIIQCVTACVIVFMDIRIVSLYGLFGVYELPYWISYFITIVFIIFVTNAFNLIDGLDGLAATIAFFSMGFMCVWFYLVGEITYAIRLGCWIGAILGFLYYNWQPASIFMGDTGSLVLGFVLAYNTLYFISCNGALPDDAMYKFPAVLSAGVALVLIPAFDTIRVFVIRIWQRKSPFLPDRQHIHHSVLRIANTHAATVRIIVGIYIIIATLILLTGKILPDWILLIIIAVICCGIDSVLSFTLKRVYARRRATNLN